MSHYIKTCSCVPTLVALCRMALVWVTQQRVLPGRAGLSSVHTAQGMFSTVQAGQTKEDCLPRHRCLVPAAGTMMVTPVTPRTAISLQLSRLGGSFSQLNCIYKKGGAVD